MIWKHRDLQRTSNLIGDAIVVENPQERPTPSTKTSLLELAGLPNRPSLFIGLTVLSATAVASVLHCFFSLWLLPFTILIGAFLPYSLLTQRIERRAAEFAEHFPTVLQATASGLSAGNTALVSIERAVRLLPKSNLVRSEVEHLLLQLQRGHNQGLAVQTFGAHIRLPELSLFRTAFQLSLENGGRLSPTLERLAHVLRDRVTLTRTARSVTAVMRMTAHVLLLVTPIVLTLIAARTENFATLLFEHPVANTTASIGFALIGCNYLILRRMSNFQP